MGFYGMRSDSLNKMAKEWLLKKKSESCTFNWRKHSGDKCAGSAVHVQEMARGQVWFVFVSKWKRV